MSEMSESEILKKINNTPELLSLLYDMDLLPEQTAYYTDRRYYRRTLALGAAWPILSAPDPLLGLVRAAFVAGWEDHLRGRLMVAGRRMTKQEVGVEALRRCRDCGSMKWRTGAYWQKQPDKPSPPAGIGGAA